MTITNDQIKSGYDKYLDQLGELEEMAGLKEQSDCLRIMRESHPLADASTLDAHLMVNAKLGYIEGLTVENSRVQWPINITVTDKGKSYYMGMAEKAREYAATV